MYNKTRLWLIATLMSSVPYAYAGKPSTPSTQQPQSPAPANSPSPNPAPSPNPGSPTPATPAQGSDTPSTPDNNNNQQPGFLSTPLGQATAVGGTIVTGVVGIGAAVELGKYATKRYQQNKPRVALNPAEVDQQQKIEEFGLESIDPKEVQLLTRDEFNYGADYVKMFLPKIMMSEESPIKYVSQHGPEHIKQAIQEVMQHLNGNNPYRYTDGIVKNLKILKEYDSLQILSEKLEALYKHFGAERKYQLHAKATLKALQSLSKSEDTGQHIETVTQHLSLGDPHAYNKDVVTSLAALKDHPSLQNHKEHIEALQKHFEFLTPKE